MKTKGNIQDIYTLSPMQEGMLLHSLLAAESPVYFEQASYRLHGQLNLDIVRKSLKRLLKRYDILRTVFIYENREQPLQVVLKDREFDFVFQDLKDSSDPEALVTEFKVKDKQRYFNLQRDILIRVSVLQIKKGEYEFVWSHHHILMDGWCRGILISEFFEIYESLLAGRTYRLKEPVQYKTFIQWLGKQNKNAAADYWRTYLEGYCEAVEVPRVIPNKKTPEGYRLRHETVQLDNDKSICLDNLARRNNATVNNVIQSAWGILLGKYNGKTDAVFGAVVSGRPSEIPGVESMVGLFINTVPVRITYEEATTYKELLRSVKESSLEGEKHHHHSLAEIQAGSALKQSLLDHIMVFENYPLASYIEGYEDKSTGKDRIKLTVSNVETFEQTNFNFNIMVIPGERLTVKIDYNEHALHPQFIKSVARHFIHLLEQVLDNEALNIGSLVLLTEDEKCRILEAFNNTAAVYPNEKPVHRFFEEQAAKNPEMTAVTTAGGDSLNYGELDRQTGQLATFLRERGVTPNTIAAVMVDRSIEMIIAIFAILKAGGAYLPIDPEFPVKRIEFMLIDSNCGILLSRDDDEWEYKRNLEVINLSDSSWRNLPTHSHQSLPADLCYVIYTSGTTGKPKGVMMEHHSLVNRFNWMQMRYPLDEDSVILHKTPFTFDVSVWELFWWSMVGAQVSLLVPNGEKDPAAIADAVQTGCITVMHFVPSMLNSFLFHLENSGDSTKLTSLKQVICSGEALTIAQVERFLKLLSTQNGTRLTNLYGPTEAAIDVTYFDCPGDAPPAVVPIGKPVDNTQLYIIDKDFHLQPVGVAGELCIAGVQLARGYLNRPELTVDKFVDFRGSRKPCRIYKTGDWCRWLPDGNIEYLGRIDHQVKVRGFRIELGEIEYQLLKHEHIHEAVVLLKPDGNGESGLTAYIVTQMELDSTDIREFLSTDLPGYMIPAIFATVEKIPLTDNGKVDRNALEALATKLAPGTAYTEPQNELEAKIVKIWKEVLGIDKVGTDDNYFDIGGNSLQIIRINAKMKQALQVDIPLVTMFRYTTVRTLAQYVISGETAVREFSSELERGKSDRMKRLKKRRG